VQFIGVSWKDDVEAMQAFVDQHGVIGFPHVEDDGSVFAAYDMVSQPGWAFIDDDGATTTVLGGLGADGIAENLDRLTEN
jgi:hypothetical protein